MKKSFFICGTDTHVGKTMVTGSLLAWAQTQGIKAVGYKPAESGCQLDESREFIREDSLFLQKMSAATVSLDEINPYYFEEALAPGVAADRAGEKILFSSIKKSFQQLVKKHDLVFVEGAGGLYVPLAGKKTNLDLIHTLKLPVILVARLGLGTINHTLLTLQAFKQARIEVVGVILNQLQPHLDLADQTNLAVLKKMGANILGIFPYTRARSCQKLARLVEENLNLKQLFNSLAK